MSHCRLPAPLAALCASVLLVLLAGCAAGPSAPPPPGAVRVTQAPLQSLDAERGGGARESESQRRAWLDALSGHLAERAASALAEGQRLDVHLSGVQRAGAFEPWRGPRAADVRIVRDIYPPRITLDFKLLAADGRVLREGQRILQDPAFMMRSSARGADDPLRYEKALIDDWVRKEFGAG